MGARLRCIHGQRDPHHDEQSTGQPQAEQCGAHDEPIHDLDLHRLADFDAEHRHLGRVLAQRGLELGRE